MQTTVDIPDEMVARLNRLSETTKTSRDVLVREALQPFLESRAPKVVDPQERAEILKDTFGAWKDFPEDGLDYQLRLRAEWDRDLDW
jgi:predicted transcriptional regulator